MTTATDTETAIETAPAPVPTTRIALPSRIGHVCADDAHRYAMNNVLVRRPAQSDAAFAAATDGRALAIARVGLESCSLGPDESIQLPSKACQIRAKAKGPLPALVASRHVVTCSEVGKVFESPDQSLPFPPIADIWKAPAAGARVARVALNPELLATLAIALSEHRSDGAAVELAFEIDDDGNARGRAIVVQALDGCVPTQSTAGLLMPCALPNPKADAARSMGDTVARAKRILAGRFD
jgi:hypothetical protein